MAIAFINLGSNSNPDINDNGSASSYAGTSWTPPTAGMIVACVQSRRNVEPPDTPTISGNSVTWVQIGTTLNTQSSPKGNGMSMFGADAALAVAGVTTVDFGGNTQIHCTVSFFHVTGVDLSGGVAAAFVQNPRAIANSTSVSVTLAAASAADNRPIGFFWHKSNETTTPRTNWNELDDMSGTGQNRGIETQERTDAFETTASASWSTSTNAGVIAAEIKAASSGTTFFETISVTGLGTAGESTISTFLRTLASTVLGASVMSRLATFAHAVVSASTGAVSFSTIKTGIQSMAGGVSGSASLVAALFKSVVISASVAGSALASVVFAAVKSVSVSVAGDVSMSPAFMAIRTIIASVVGTAVIVKAMSHTIAVSGIGTAALTTAKFFTRVIAASVSGAVAYDSLIIKAVFIASSAAGTAVVSTLSTRLITIASSSIGTSVVSRISTFFKTITTTGLGTAATSLAKFFIQVITASVSGDATQSEVFILGIIQVAISATVVGASALSSISTRFRTISVSSTGSAIVSRAATIFKSISASGVGSVIINAIELGIGILFTQTINAEVFTSITISRAFDYILEAISRTLRIFDSLVGTEDSLVISDSIVGAEGSLIISDSSLSGVSKLRIRHWRVK